MALTNIIFFVLFLGLMLVSGSWLVRSGIIISKFLHVPEFTLGFIIMAVATSLPELFVGISAALNSTPSLLLGTVIGSNIANLGLVAGIGILLARTVRIETKDARIDSIVMVIISSIPLVLMVVGMELSRIDGLVLILTFISYYIYVFKRRKEYSKEFDGSVSRKMAVFQSITFMVSLLLLFLSAKWTVEYASLIAIDFSLPPMLIGLFLIALGTSLPELVLSARAMILHHSELSIGTIIGSNITNVSLVLGITALISPIQASPSVFLSSAIYMIVVSIVFTALIESRRIGWIGGVSLLMMYIFFMFLEFSVNLI
jgi:cation:H+ antiporter